MIVTDEEVGGFHSIRDSKGLASHLESLHTSLYSDNNNNNAASATSQVRTAYRAAIEDSEDSDNYAQNTEENNNNGDNKRISNPQFTSFYQSLFPFLKAEGSKSLPKDMAIPVFEIVLGEKFKLGKEFVEFANVSSCSMQSL